MRENNLWFYDDSPIPPCVNWYQSKYSEHSYDPTILATRKIHRHDRAHKFNNRDKSCSLDYSKHVHKSCGKDEDKSSSHSKHVHKSRSRNENKSSSRSPHDHQHSRRDEIRFPNYSRMLHLIEGMQKDVGMLRESIIAYFATQHSLAITNSESEISSCILETDKLPDSDYLSEGVHKDDSEDVSLQDSAPITFPLDIIAPVTNVLSPGDPALITFPSDIIAPVIDVLSPGDPALITFPSDTITPVTDVLSPGDPSPNLVPTDTITQVTDGDPASITSPSDSISPVADDHSSLEEEKQEEASHMLSHHYVGDPYLHDIIWYDGLPYQQILAPSPPRSMLLLLMNCLPSLSPTMQLQSLLHPKSLPKIGTIDSLLWKQRPPRRSPER